MSKGGEKSMKLTKLLSLLMYSVDIVEYYDENMKFWYSFQVSEIPENCKDRFSKFNIYEKEGKRILEIITKD